MNIFLTGGSGFIGKNINESYLAEKYNILSPSHNNLELEDDRAVRDFFLKNNIDIVIHGAVKPGHRLAEEMTGLLYTNTRMFFNLVRNSHRFKKLIFLGSGMVYDKNHYKPQMKEEFFDSYVPSDEGGFSKYLISKYIQKTDNMVDLRLFGVFGKYELYNIRFISNAICKAIFNLPVTIKQNRKFDYLYINDLMHILDYFIQNKFEYSAYNVCSSNPIELSSLAEKVIKISGKDLPLQIGTAGMGVEYSGDNTRLKSEIKDLNFTSINKSIKELYGWYENNKEKINYNYLLIDP